MARWDRWGRGKSDDSNTHYYDEKGNKTTYSSEDYAYKTVMRGARRKTFGWSLASLIFGAASVFFGILGWAGMVFGAVAIILSLFAKRNLGYFDGMAIAGLVLGIFGSVFSLGVIIIVYSGILPEEFLRGIFTGELPNDGGSSGGGLGGI